MWDVSKNLFFYKRKFNIKAQLKLNKDYKHDLDITKTLITAIILFP